MVEFSKDERERVNYEAFLLSRFSLVPNSFAALMKNPLRPPIINSSSRLIIKDLPQSNSKTLLSAATLVKSVFQTAKHSTPNEFREISEKAKDLMEPSLVLNAEILNSSAKAALDWYEKEEFKTNQNLKVTTSMLNKLVQLLENLDEIPKALLEIPLENQDAYYGFVYLKYLVKRNQLDDALLYLNSLREQKIVNINHVNFLLRSLFIAKRPKDAIDLYQLVSKFGLLPNEITFSILINNTMSLKMYVACEQFVN